MKNITLFLLLITVTACSPYDFDELGGVSLGEAGGVVYGTSEIGEVMFVFSDIPDICDELYSADAPQFADWWVISAWTRSAPRTNTELPASGFGAVSVLDDVSEYSAQEASINLSAFEDDEAVGDVELNFDNGDIVKAAFTAEPCSAPLFFGIE